MEIPIHFCPASVVMLPTIGELNTLFLRSLLFMLDIIMPAVEKCTHSSESGITAQVPVPWLGPKCASLGNEVNVFVTVATKLIMQANHKTVKFNVIQTQPLVAKTFKLPRLS